MNPQRLPADLAVWPKEPLAVLGVARDVDRKSLKRAYTALLREFNPEHFPEHFRRIREAYESVLQQVEWREMSQVWQPVVQPEEAPPQPAATAPPAAKEDEQSLEETTTPVPGSAREPPARPEPASALNRWHDDLDALWQRAVAGDVGGYRRLVEMEQQFSGRRDLCLRLYWLLVAWPELDARREPCDWLVRGLRLGGLAGPLAELYRREIADRPAEGLSQRCAVLLDARAQNGPLADLVAARWRAAGQLGQFEPIAEDLEHLRERLFPAAEDVWSRLLLAASEQLCWSPLPEMQRLAKMYWEELDELSHLHVRLRQELDRVEAIRSVAADWHKVSGASDIPADLLQLVRLSAHREADEVAPAALRVLQGLLADHRKLLVLFDRIHKASPAVLGQIGQIIGFCGGCESSAPRNDATQIRVVAQMTIAACLTKDYATVRLHLLRFCLQEQISPETLISLPDLNLARPESVNMALLRSIAADGPLRLAYLAHRALGA